MKELLNKKYTSIMELQDKIVQEYDNEYYVATYISDDSDYAIFDDNNYVVCSFQIEEECNCYGHTLLNVVNIKF